VKKDDLEREFIDLEGQIRSSAQHVGDSDSRLMLGTVLLGRAIIKLDRTSTFLSRVNISVGVVVVLIGVFQIFLMLRAR
jgi:hypothetical protein